MDPTIAVAFIGAASTTLIGLGTQGLAAYQENKRATREAQRERERLNAGRADELREHLDHAAQVLTAAIQKSTPLMN